MHNNDLFKVENFIFVSSHEGVVGSLYFRAVDECGVHRGRIRLNHEDGPKVSNPIENEKKWFLVSENIFEQYKKTRDDGIPIDSHFADLINSDWKEKIINARGQTIYEIYSTTHSSRGQLVPVECLIPKLEQCQIEWILGTIRNNEKADVDCSNIAIIELTNDSSKKFPDWIRQKKGIYGC